jgi:hypothetical protein
MFNLPIFNRGKIFKSFNKSKSMTNKDQVPGGSVMPGTAVPGGAIMPGQNLTQDALKGEATLSSAPETAQAPVIDEKQAKTIPTESTITQKRWVNGMWV